MRISDWSSDVCSSDLVRTASAASSFEACQTPSPSCGMAWPSLSFMEAWEDMACSTDHTDGALTIGRIWPVEQGQRPGHLRRRSEERRVGNECVSPCKYRGSPDH